MTYSPSLKHFDYQAMTDGVITAIAKDGGAAVSNSGLIDLGGQILVFDTFLTPQAAADLRQLSVEILGRPPDLVINSHYHNDHIWGNQVFENEALILSSSRTRKLITTAGQEEFRWYTANSAQRLENIRAQYANTGDEQLREQLFMWLGYYEGLVESLPNLKVCLPGITFESRLELHGERRTAELITFEGAHTESDAILYIPEERIAFVSDLLFVGCHPYLADGDPVRLLNSLQELSRLDAAHYIPGHGPVGDLEDLRLMIGYIVSCMETARQLVDEGNTDDDSISELSIRAEFTHWQLSQFYQTNIRFLCERLHRA